jgi:hypothetical protein
MDKPIAWMNREHFYRDREVTSETEKQVIKPEDDPKPTLKFYG